MKGYEMNFKNLSQSSPLSSPANSPSKKLVKDAINILTFEDVGDFITSRITNDTCYYVDKALKIADSKTDLGTNHLNGFINSSYFLFIFTYLEKIKYLTPLTRDQLQNQESHLWILGKL